MNCRECGGEGTVLMLFVHRVNKTFRTPLLSCPSCGGESNGTQGKRAGEELANYEGKPLLIEQGYKHIH
ncbi:MAG: hypothetical protein KBC50_02150 [Candidatus Pacebacteria bacterium]|nr:hypothetical protein [Candidatus Paceibacterota bacterium]